MLHVSVLLVLQSTFKCTDLSIPHDKSVRQGDGADIPPNVTDDDRKFRELRDLSNSIQLIVSGSGSARTSLLTPIASPLLSMALFHTRGSIKLILLIHPTNT